MALGKARRDRDNIHLIYNRANMRTNRFIARTHSLVVCAVALAACSEDEKPPVPQGTIDALSGAYEIGKEAILESREFKDLHEGRVEPLIDWDEEARYMDDGKVRLQKKDGGIWTTNDNDHATVLLDIVATNGSGESYRPNIFANLKFSDGEWKVADVIGTE